MEQIYRGMENAAQKINDNFSELNGKISNIPVTTVSGQAVISGTNYTAWIPMTDGIRYMQQGNMVVIDIQKRLAPTTSSYTLGTLPVGMRPKNFFNKTIESTSVSDYADARMSVDSSGIVKISNGKKSGEIIATQICFFLG